MLLVLAYFGTFMFFDESFNIVLLPPLDADLQATARLHLNTIMFHTFIYMTLFNAINCRVTDEKEKNMFKELCNNYIFWFMLIAEFTVQNGFIYSARLPIGPTLFGMAPISLTQRIICGTLGLTVYPVFILGKLIPLKHFEFMKKVDLEGDIGDNYAKRILERGKKEV